MGVAIAGAALAIGGAAYGAYSSSQANKATQGNISSTQGALNNAMANVPNVAPVTFDQLQLPSANSAFDQYLDQMSSFGGLSQAATREDKAWQGILNRTSPGLSSSIALGSQLSNQYLQGNLSAQTQGNVQRSSAYKALQGGFGASSGAGNALSARDLGLTTQSQQQLGYSMLPQQVSMSQAMNPVNPANLLFSPAQLLQRSDQQSIFNVQTANSNKAYNTSLDLENQNSRFAALMQKAGLGYQLGQASINSNNSANQAVASGITSVGTAAIGAGGGLGSIAGAFGGGNSGGMTNSGFYTSAGAAQTGYYGAGGTGPVAQAPGGWYGGMSSGSMSPVPT